MRWFTRDCLTGGLDDQEWQKRYDDYEIHFSALMSTLASDSPERTLAELSLHDGIPLSITVDGSSFDLVLVVGDLQRGYERTRITYQDAELLPSNATLELERWPLGERELIADELERLPDGRFEQRLLFWPDGEFAVRFSTCSVTRTPADSSDREVLPGT